MLFCSKTVIWMNLTNNSWWFQKVTIDVKVVANMHSDISFTRDLQMASIIISKVLKIDFYLEF